jgi:very-short-patch-repair endonuclease
VNSDGGEKRLNVAVTRAREEFHIFSSITAEDIDLSRTKARGVADLKNFLDYASRGAIALPAMDHGSLGPAENMFEVAIASALEAKGWEVRTQIGVSGFRIDLAVVHPHHAGAYLAGVECDGATYHSSASARDRDKIREGVLESLGWNILRIWSTDWFRNPKDTIERTDSDLRALLASSVMLEECESETVEEAEPLDPPAS